MCGRFTQKSEQTKITEQFYIKLINFDYQFSYNIAPSQKAAVAYVREGEIILDGFQFGLVPYFAAKTKKTYTMINARSETALEKPSFKKPLLQKRCIIPADGFFEWRKTAPSKIPYYIHSSTDDMLGLAGIYEFTEMENGQIIQSFAILTTTPNSLMQKLHDRMPCILPREKYSAWLDPALQDGGLIMEFLKPCPSEALASYPVTRLVNSPANNSPDCIKPA